MRSGGNVSEVTAAASGQSAAAAEVRQVRSGGFSSHGGRARPGEGRPVDLLDAATLAKLAGVKLRARAVMEGVLSGLHKSPHQGQSVEFAEHKEYAPGDELRHLDWKAFGKFDQLLRQALRARDEPARGHGGRRERAPWATGAGALSKLEVATTLAGALATCSCASRTRRG